MCGILGSFYRNEGSNQSQRLQSALAALQHRGPDDCGFESFVVADGNLTLGHARLSIIDLSSSGHQPMHSSEGRYTIVFNGEIYNYRELRQELTSLGHAFHTDSDTEVLLACWAQWGADCLVRLRGMYAFAVFDRENDTLTCVRDGFGIKPLFYRWDDTGFWFASELPALLTIIPNKPGLNFQRAYDYLVWGSYDNKEETFFKDIQHLMPGHSMVVHLRSKQRPASERWWQPSIVERTDLGFEQATDQLREMFLNNVHLHLRSDVPLGAALSGGIDSSSVVCAMRHIEPDMPIHTFSYVPRGSTLNEEEWVDQVNSHCNAIPHKVVVEPYELVDDLDDVIRAQGEPFGSTSIYAQYRVFRLAKEKGITVTLDGQGADELLAGYHGYPHARVRSLLEREDFTVLIRFLNDWSQWPGRSRKQALQILGSATLPETLISLARSLSSKDSQPHWLDAEFLQASGVLVRHPQLLKVVPEDPERSLVETLRKAQTGNGLMSLLRHGDRNSMRWSIESRVPFLTTDLAEFLLSLPEEYLLSNKGETKYIFRRAMRGIVPDEILDRKDKIGFETPEQNWFKSLGPTVLNWMEGIEDLPFLNSQACRSEVESVINGFRPFSWQAWRLINFCRWAQLNEASL